MENARRSNRKQEEKKTAVTAIPPHIEKAAIFC